jgi:hypothetical protein
MTKSMRLVSTGGRTDLFQEGIQNLEMWFSQNKKYFRISSVLNFRPSWSWNIEVDTRRDTTNTDTETNLYSEKSTSSRLQWWPHY